MLRDIENIWCTGTPQQLRNGVSTQKKHFSTVRLHSPKTRSWRRRENIWSRGWRRRRSQLGSSSVSCPLCAGVFTVTVELRRFLLQNSPQIQPHPADTQPPCESERRGSFAACRGVRLAKKGGMGAVPLHRHAGRAQNCLCRHAGQIAQKISLADCNWMADELWSIVSMPLDCGPSFTSLHSLSFCPSSVTSELLDPVS